MAEVRYIIESNYDLGLFGPAFDRESLISGARTNQPRLSEAATGGIKQRLLGANEEIRDGARDRATRLGDRSEDRQGHFLANSKGQRRREAGAKSARIEGRPSTERRGPDIASPVRGRWPARPGESQHEWEQPRVADAPIKSLWRARFARQALDGSVKRLLGLPTHGITRWLGRLANWHNREIIRAAGDALVPHIAEAIGRAIIEMDRLNSEFDGTDSPDGRGRE